MATAIATTAILQKAWAEAADARGRAHKLVTEAEARVRELRLPLLPIGVDLPTYTAEDRLRAHIGLPAAEHELSTRRLDALEADEREEAARAALRAAIDAEVRAERRQVCAQMARLLLEVRPLADRLADLETRSPSGDGILWPVLQSSSSLFTSQLDVWLKWCREYGVPGVPATDVAA